MSIAHEIHQRVDDLYDQASHLFLGAFFVFLGTALFFAYLVLHGEIGWGILVIVAGIAVGVEIAWKARGLQQAADNQDRQFHEPGW